MPIQQYGYASRVYEFVPGSGSHVGICLRNQFGVMEPWANARTLDIAVGTVRHIYKNKITTHSGGDGSTDRTRTGFDWNFALALTFPAALQGGELAAAFVEDLMASSRKIGMIFHVGRPEFWTNRQNELPTRSYRSNNALLSTSEVVLDSSGDEVVGLNVAGDGSSMLWMFLGEVAYYPGVWF